MSLDGSNLIELAGNPIAQLAAAAATFAGAWRYFRNQSSGDAVTRANDAANISALEAWKELLEGERAARKVAEERADKFAEERNQALGELWELKGQLKVMNETIAEQTREVHELRDQVRKLQEKLNAN